MTAIALDRLFTQASFSASREQRRELILSEREANIRPADNPPSQAVINPATSPQVTNSTRLAVNDLVPPATKEAAAVAPSLSSRSLTPELRVAVQMMQLLSGKKFELFALDYLPESTSSAGQGMVYDFQGQLSVSSGQASSVADDTPVLVIEEVVEKQRMQYAAYGEATLGDGSRQVFSVSLMMASEHRQWQMSAVTAGALKDPLVLNMSADGVSLSDKRHNLDLDADGEQETVAMLGQQSFYLVLDHNKNGVVDDGTELFGALSGDGFADLAQLDDDGNGFVDQADSAFSQLRLWQPDREQWLSLADMDVIALYVAGESTPFLLKNSEMELLGAVRSTGFFLRGDGPAGTLQQLDLVV